MVSIFISRKHSTDSKRKRRENNKRKEIELERERGGEGERGRKHERALERGKHNYNHQPVIPPAHNKPVTVVWHGAHMCSPHLTDFLPLTLAARGHHGRLPVNALYSLSLSTPLTLELSATVGMPGRSETIHDRGRCTRTESQLQSMPSRFLSEGLANFMDRLLAIVPIYIYIVFFNNVYIYIYLQYIYIYISIVLVGQLLQVQTQKSLLDGHSV